MLLRISLITLSVIFLQFLHSCKEEPNTAPVADFTITPSYGTTDTNFNFDASTSTDLEDPVDVLQVRWDWESDSIFDTDFNTSKSIQHKFEKGGTFYISVEVKDSKGKTSRFTDFVKVNWTNRPPRAAMNVTPPKGYLQDVFNFDASASSDYEDKNSELLVHWDFNGDGTWDTEFSKTKTVTHQYTVAGTYSVKLEVKDSGGATDDETFSLVVGATNQPPETPKDPVPANLASDASTLCVLEWTCADPETDTLKFDVYFGEQANPPLVAQDWKTTEYTCLPLDYTTTYFWKIVAKDTYGHVVTGPVWSFGTNSPVNPMGTMTDPRDRKVYKWVNINGRIWMAENLNIGTMIHASTGGDNGDGYQRNNNKAEKFCYKNDPAYCDIYGGLYQWDEAMGFTINEKASGLCPEGWHMPTDAEWHELALYLEPDEAEKLAGDKLILGSRTGFQALFAGYLIFAERKYYDLTQGAYFWSSTINGQINYMALGRSIFVAKSNFQQDTFQRVSGLPVRCLKDY